MPFSNMGLTKQEQAALMRNRRYWASRSNLAQANLTAKNVKEIEKQLAKYYKSAMTKVVSQFESTFIKINEALGDGKNPTPADLYKLDTYWKMQAQLKKELNKLGNQQLDLFSKKFVEQYSQIYGALALQGDLFSEADEAIARQMINHIWCADGQSWSNRVWTNVANLQDTLNEELLHCVLTGKKSSELKEMLQNRFGVSYSGADMIVRTEMAHIQTQAAKQRYIDYGIEEVEILADEDERQCDICGKLHGKRFPAGAQVPIPAHPRCRCCIIPVVD